MKLVVPAAAQTPVSAESVCTGRCGQGGGMQPAWMNFGNYCFSAVAQWPASEKCGYTGPLPVNVHVLCDCNLGRFWKHITVCRSICFFAGAVFKRVVKGKEAEIGWAVNWSRAKILYSINAAAVHFSEGQAVQVVSGVKNKIFWFSTALLAEKSSCILVKTPPTQLWYQLIEAVRRSSHRAVNGEGWTDG